MNHKKGDVLKHLQKTQPAMWKNMEEERLAIQKKEDVDKFVTFLYDIINRVHVVAPPNTKLLFDGSVVHEPIFTNFCKSLI